MKLIIKRGEEIKISLDMDGEDVNINADGETIAWIEPSGGIHIMEDLPEGFTNEA